MAQIGELAPALSLPDADMELVELSALRGKKVVLFFYLRDDTPGCTIEATDFTDLESEFARAECVVLGISRDDVFSHAEFRDKHGISVRLLSDPDCEACERYQVMQDREVDGQHKRGVVRSTFIIDRDGVIRHIYPCVQPRGHAQDVLRYVKMMN